ncbi:36471_t:CDS:1, partial [Racocetra persica]
FLAIDERDNKLIAEAKNLPVQRIVPVFADSSQLPVSLIKSKSKKTKSSSSFKLFRSASVVSTSSKLLKSRPSSLNYQSYDIDNRLDSVKIDSSPDLSPALQAATLNSTPVLPIATLNSAPVLPAAIFNSNLVLPAATIKSKPPKIETLYNFLDFQSFDGSFLPSTKFYSWFDKNNFEDFKAIEVENEKILCTALAMAYLEIIMFETFKEECEMCYEKAEKVLKKDVVYKQKINEILKKVKEWVKKWADE